VDSALRKLFISYASIGDTSNVSALPSSRFSKLFKDSGLTSRSSLTTVDIDLAFVRTAQQGPTKSGAAKKSHKTISYAQFLEATYALAAKLSGDTSPILLPNGRRGLLMLLMEYLLPLAERGSRGAPASVTGDQGAIGEEELLSHASTLEAIFAHYSNPAKLSPAVEGRTQSPNFWEELRLERDAFGVDDADDSAGDAGRGGSVAAIDLSAWQRLMSHFGVCPSLLSKVELGRVFQQEAQRRIATG
jgi:hypothetical protein